MRRLDCSATDCGAFMTSRTQAGTLNALVKHCAEKHPDLHLDQAALADALDRMTVVRPDGL